MRTDFNDYGLIYEHLVAPIRQRPPLAFSTDVLKAVTGLLLAGAIGVGTYVAFDGQPWYVESGYALATGGALLSAVLSLTDMLRAWGEAKVQILRASQRRTQSQD